ncbi:hypothetical protein J4219_02725 [Candidatus Woesearchaeota archaeon]|nr:hypothetical protein [Candidatus Woesearchaeota archaeon]
MISGIDLVGFVGALLILLAFWLVTRKVVHPESFSYLSLNLLGALLLGVETYRRASYAALSLNIIWALVALYGIFLARKRKEAKLRR